MSDEKMSSEQIYDTVIALLELRKNKPDMTIPEFMEVNPTFSAKYPSLTEKIYSSNDKNVFDLGMLRKMLGLRDKVTPQNLTDANLQMHQNLYKQYVQPKLSRSKLEKMIDDIIQDLEPLVMYVSQRRPQWERVNMPEKLFADLEENYKSIMDKYKFIVGYILEKNIMDWDQIREYLETFYMSNEEIVLVK